MHKPEIRYPCEWEYKIIGADAEAIRAAIVTVVGEAEHAVDHSRASRTGKYVSLQLVVIVRDEEHRLGIYQALVAHRAVKIVL